MKNYFKLLYGYKAQKINFNNSITLHLHPKGEYISDQIRSDQIIITMSYVN